MKKELTCEERVEKELEDRMDDLHKLWDAYQEGDEEVDDLGNIFDYGLSVDYVAPQTFPEQYEGYLRYQLSWGGPSDEFRFFINPDLTVHRIEYWFLDWYDGASIRLTGDDWGLLNDIYDWFVECGTVEAEIDKARD